MSTQEPRTEAGRTLRDALVALDRSAGYEPLDFAHGVRIVEAEARSTALTAVEVAVAGLTRDRGDETWDTVVRQEVLAAITALRQGDTE